MYMMLVPRRNGFGFFDDFFEDEFFKGRTRDLMRTDIIEKDDKYIVDIDLPGFEKPRQSGIPAPAQKYTWKRSPRSGRPPCRTA